MFSLTICSSIIFIILFTIWVIKLTPSVPQQTHIQFNASSLITVRTLTGFNGNSSVSGVKGSILINTQLRKTENASGFSGVFIGGLQIKNSEPQEVEDEENEDGDFTENSPPMVEIVPEILSEKNEVSSGEENVTEISLKKVEIPSGGETIVEEEKKQQTSFGKDLVSRIERVKEKRTKDCDVTRGRWVFDESYPLYTNGYCPFIDEGFNCQGNGRPDKAYMKLRWQPQDCDIPRYYLYFLCF